MLLTKQGKEFLDNIDDYREFGLHTLVNISGIEILKDNKIIPVSTIYLESDDGDILFVADYCTPRDEKELIAKIKKSLEITKERNFLISENEGPEKNQEMIKYIAYSNPDIRPVLFTGEVSLDDNKVQIVDNKIVLNEQEESPTKFLTTLFSPDDSLDKKIQLIEELNKKKNSLSLIIEQLVLITAILEKDTVLPKIVEANGDEFPGIVFKNEKGKYQAMIIGREKPELVNKFKILKGSTWAEITDNIKNNDFINDRKDEFIEKLMKENQLPYA